MSAPKFVLGQKVFDSASAIVGTVCGIKIELGAETTYNISDATYLIGELRGTMYTGVEVAESRLVDLASCAHDADGNPLTFGDKVHVTGHGELCAVFLAVDDDPRNYRIGTPDGNSQAVAKNDVKRA